MSTRRGKVFASILGSSLKLGLRFCLPMAFFLLSLLSLALIGSLSLSTADEFIFQICRKERNYTANSPFQKNIEGLIASLSSLAPATGFAIDTVGEVPDRVYGLAVCRADIDGAKCRGCLAGAAQGAAPACPGNKGATVFYDLCHLRYSDQSFFGESTGTEYYMTNPQNASDVPTFNRLLGRLLNNLTTRAASSERMFAAGVVDFTDFQKVYALVQCTRDLSPETCDACLRSEISYIPVCCEAKQGARVAGGSCFLRYEVYPFFTAAADTPAAAPPSLLPKNTPPVRIPAAEDKKSNTLTIPLSISIALVFSLAILAAIGIYMWRTRQRKPLGGREEGDANQSDSFQFSFEALKLATLNFSNQNKLGEGGFGVVYKGVLADGQYIAVKRLVNGCGERLGELKNEVGLVAKLQHRNLVRLLGYCLQAEEKILVYEYLPNKSLDKFLFDPIRSKALTWERRVKIIEGIARGLLYLHEDSRLKIIHRDLKASNILLDEWMNPKIADFGLARLFGNEQSYENTQRIAGTQGYMGPEYMMHGQISTKSDVYSFGVLVLEIVTGKKCIGFHGSNPPTNLISYIWRLWEEGNPLEAIDKGMGEVFLAEEVLRRIHIGLLCIQHDPLERPNMSTVVLLLSTNSTSLQSISPFSSFSPTTEGLSASPRESNMLRPPTNDIMSFETENTTLEPR